MERYSSPQFEPKDVDFMQKPGRRLTGLREQTFRVGRPPLPMSRDPHDMNPSWWHDVFDQCAQLRYLYDRAASTDLRLRCSLLAASVQPGERARVAIVSCCMDGVTSNPLTWCALCTGFPALQFELVCAYPR